MKNWWVDEELFLKQVHNIIPTQEMKEPYKMLITMLDWLYEEDKDTHFQTDWLSVAHTILKTRQVFNWDDILDFQYMY